MFEFFKKYKEFKKSFLLPDKIEIGTPGKGGVVSIHGNFEDPEGFQVRIDNAMKLREYARQKYEESSV